MEVGLEIKKRLKEKKSPMSIVKELFYKIGDKETSFSQKEELIGFCLNAGLYRVAFDIFSVWLRKREVLPLGQLIELLSLKIKKPEKEFIQLLLEGAKKEGLEFNVVQSKVWDSFDSRIKKMRQRFFEKKKILLKNKKIFFMEKLNFFRAQNRLKEEKKMLKEVYTFFPDDPDILEHIRDFSERWSSSFLSEYSNQKASEAFFLNLNQKIKLKEDSVFNIIKNHVFEKAKTHSHLAYHLSLLFYFMEKYSEAYDVLEYAVSSYEIDFYAVEILIKSSRYFEALEAIEKIKLKYDSKTEMPFLATYLKAQALKGIGHVTKAIELLEQIVSLRPNFLLAHEFIEKWSLL